MSEVMAGSCVSLHIPAFDAAIIPSINAEASDIKE
jgi:hypothetical protein